MIEWVFVNNWEVTLIKVENFDWINQEVTLVNKLFTIYKR